MRRLEAPVPIKDILHARRETYLHHAGGRSYTADRDLAGYEEKLPRFRGQTVTQLIEGKIAQGAESVSVLDIGCGEGRFLAGLIRKYPQVKAFGISAFDYRKESSPWKKLLDEADYRVGDAQRLASVFPDVEFDITVSRLTMVYVNDPLSVLRQAYRRTKPGGIILLDKLGTELTDAQSEHLQKRWEQEGIEVELESYNAKGDEDAASVYSLAIQKASDSRLYLPFRYSLNGKTIGYFFDEEAAKKVA